MKTPPPATRGLVIDAVLSFAVYLVPLITLHVLWTTGSYLVFAASRRTGPTGWLAMDWAAVLAAQAVLFAILRIGRRRLRPLVRTLVTVATLAAAVPVLNVLLLGVIPLRHLTEASTTPEANTLKELCRVDGVALHPRVGTLHPHGTEASMIVVRQGAYRPAQLRVPGCVVQDLDLPTDVEVGTISPSGGILWRTREASRQGQGHWFVTSPSGVTSTAPIVVAGPNVPQLLDDGRTVAWLERDPSPHINVVSDGSVRQIEGAGVPDVGDAVLEGLGPEGPFHIAVVRAETRWVSMDGKGQATSSLEAPPEVEPHGHHLRPLPGGWIAWDTYRETGRYVITWNVDGRTGTRTLPKGLGFTSVAFDARGEYIAISATSGLNIGSQRDEVWVVRTADGVELFRRYAPKYSRAVVALPAGRYFAMDETRDGRSAVRVYELGK